MASAKVSIDTRSLSHHHIASPLSSLWQLSSPSFPMPPLFGSHPHPQYNWELSTEENHETVVRSFCGRFQKIRQRLDYQYHANYSCARQLLQDAIIEAMLKNTTVGNQKDTAERSSSSSSDEPWIIFTAGVMGAGKTHVMKQLHSNGQFPLETFVSVDPDEIRRLLPEFQVYVESCPERAGELTRKEAGMVAEILTEAALERGQNVLVDGSLRDAAWYAAYFQTLRQSFHSLKLGIIHVTAPIGEIFQRVEQRAKSTGRVVPRDVLLKSAEQVPKSVEILRQCVDFFLAIQNSGEDSSTNTTNTVRVAVQEHFQQTCTV